MGVNQWMRIVDTVANLAQMSGRLRRPEPEAREPGAPGPQGGPMAQLETRLAGVVVAALKEAFDRDRARMDLEREHLEAERRRAEEALKAELRRQAIERALGQVRLIAVMAIGVWMLSAALGVWLPGMRGGGARWLLGAGWLCALGALGTAFSTWQRISRSSADDSGAALANSIASWLLLGAIALSGAALLVAL